MNNDWEHFGEEIKQTIQDAIDTKDYSRLNQMVSDTVNHAMDCVSAGIKNGGWYRDPKTGQPLYGNKKNTGSRSGAENQGYRPNQESKMSEMRNYSQNRPVPVTPRYLKGTSVKIGGTFLAATGAVFGLTSVIFLIITLIGSLITAFDVVSGLIIGIFAVAFISFAVMTYVGVDMVRTVGRFRQYVSVLRDREFCDIKEIASATGRDVRKVLKDVKKMITKGWFCQGHLDEKESCLMVSEHAWNQYTALMEDMKQRKAEEQAAQKKMQEEYDRLSPEVQKIVQAGDEYVRKIKAANDAIPGEVISAKISRMELLVDRIFDRVEQNPDSVNDMRRMMDYYLPTTMKLLEAYEELDAQPVQGENIISSKKEIEDTIDTLNIAFEKLLDSLFQDTAWDVSSDISVLHTMLAQEGLTEDGLKK
ncbi:MAG: 5-bromo-4-chloroindolyl phosphate hydrolysis family protein [Mediterraneibacter faecis]